MRSLPPQPHPPLPSTDTTHQLHPAPRQRHAIRLYHPSLPVALLAPTPRRGAILLPLQPLRHPALYDLLDPPPGWRHLPHCRAVGMHHPMAQLENHMGCATAVLSYWRLGGLGCGIYRWGLVGGRVSERVL